MIYVGLDPSLAGFGYAVCITGELRRAGVWKTKPDSKATKTADRARRVHLLGSELLATLRACKAKDSVSVLVEGVAYGFGKTSLVTASGLGRVFGMVEGVTLALDIPMNIIRPERLKLAMLGNRSGSKAEMAHRLYQLKPSTRGIGLDDNGVDACCLALCAETLGRVETLATPNYHWCGKPEDEIEF